MPCSDITDILSLTIDHEDRVIHYSFSKLTCGAAVGSASLLRKWIENRSVSDILSSALNDVLAVQPTRSQTWEYLTLKHLKALQHGLRAMVGEHSCGPDDMCAIQSIETDQRGIKMLALVKVDLIISDIEACGNCCHRQD